MAKYQKLVNKADLLLNAWAAAYKRYAALDNLRTDEGIKVLKALENARNALLGFIGSLAGRNDDLHERLEVAREANESLRAELATYKPQIPEGLPFDLEAAKAGKPMQVRRTENGKIDWIDAHFIGVRSNGHIVFETKEYGVMHASSCDWLRIVPKVEQVTLWANVYRNDAGLYGYMTYNADKARADVDPIAIATAIPVTITVVK